MKNKRKNIVKNKNISLMKRIRMKKALTKMIRKKKMKKSLMKNIKKKKIQ